MARSESSRRGRLALVAPVALAFASASELPQPFVFVAGVEGAGHHGIVHALLHGKYMRVAKGPGGYVPAEPLKRYWRRDLWTNFFSFLLNAPTRARDASRGGGSGARASARRARRACRATTRMPE